MKQILGGVFVGMLIAGILVGITIPLLPPSARHAWVAGLIAGVSVAASVYVARRMAKTPPR